MIKAENIILRPCPFCSGEVELWKYQEIIKCRFICKKCKVEVEFPKGFDTKTCIKKWNKENSFKQGISAKLETKDLSETLCMDEGPNQFKTVQYKPTCHCGYSDCVWDPAYILATYPKWYVKLYGETTNPEDVSCEKQGTCKDGERYDDEDK